MKMICHNSNIVVIDWLILCMCSAPLTPRGASVWSFACVEDESSGLSSHKPWLFTRLMLEQTLSFWRGYVTQIHRYASLTPLKDTSAAPHLAICLKHTRCLSENRDELPVCVEVRS